ncbi:protein PRRC2A [Monomorium pharaonis]|uniref:protein PRRC2A n=1 Tax=Monomorium pharaonis TaxID=307658 RepID=UPI0017477539|nr:protein PRRC2A [Monomorium pharaonis]XP_036146103.1 protein PRRC2A [Monomorium pharaonis]
MYGLYRAWFGGGATGGTTSYPCLQDTFSPPDTVVRVGNEGEHQFVAHKGVLAAHSGYLKALLASATTTTAATPSTSSPFDPACATVAVTATSGQSQRPVTSVSVSSIGGEAFAPLLNYMYTGRLEVTLDNVYSVLLATHLLHMPGALEQCRAALLRLRAPPPLPTPPLTSATSGSSPGTAGNILRPIPSRLVVGPPLCWPPAASLAYPPAAPAPTALSHLPPSMQPLMQPTMPPGINVVASREKQEQCARYSTGEMSKSPESSSTVAHHKRPRLNTSRSRTPEIVSTVSTLPFVAAGAAAFTAFAVTSSTASSVTRAPPPSPSRSVSPASPSSVSRTHSPVHHSRDDRLTERDAQRRGGAGGRGEGGGGGEEVEDCSARSSNDQLRKSVASTSTDSRPPNNRNGNDDDGNNDNGSTVISEYDRARSSRRRSRISAAKETPTTSTVFSVVYDIACCDGPVRFHRVLNENYTSATSHGPPSTPARRNCQPESEDPSSENDENGGPAARGGGGGGHARSSPSHDSSNDGSSNGNNGGCYTCGYCKHTFKSQYCYRKHAKRHLLPTRINEAINSGGGVGGGGGGGGGSGDDGGDGAAAIVSHGPRQDPARGARREVRLLDLNVQYYPCKICGCKFPSYYFVHKHRKLCHANDEERQGATDGANASSRDADASSTQDAP